MATRAFQRPRLRIRNSARAEQGDEYQSGMYPKEVERCMIFQQGQHWQPQSDALHLASQGMYSPLFGHEVLKGMQVQTPLFIVKFPTSQQGVLIVESPQMDINQ